MYIYSPPPPPKVDLIVISHVTNVKDGLIEVKRPVKGRVTNCPGLPGTLLISPHEVPSLETLSPWATWSWCLVRQSHN